MTSTLALNRRPILVHLATTNEADGIETRWNLIFKEMTNVRCSLIVHGVASD